MHIYHLQEAYLKAYHFAARAHQEQKYPGTHISYIMHLSFVSMEVQQALAYHRVQNHPKNETLAIQCALLHDVLEDTATPYEDVHHAFGDQVAQGVMALSKNNDLPKNERMSDSLQRILQQPVEVAMVKMADRISNLQKPPAHWTDEKCQRYQQEALMIFDHLSSACPYLAHRLKSKIDLYKNLI